MKIFLRLVCGVGVVAGSFALVGCDSSSDEGVPAVIPENKAGAEAMKKLTSSMPQMSSKQPKTAPAAPEKK